MRIHIDLGALFRLFKKKKVVTIPEREIDWTLVTEDAIMSACESNGTFEIFHIENNEELKKKIVSDIVKEFNSMDKTIANLIDAVEDGFDDNDHDLSPKQAKLVVDCFLDSLH